MLWLGCGILALLSLVTLVLLFLLFLETRVTAHVSLGKQATGLTVEAGLFFRALKVRFWVQGANRKIGVFVGRWNVWRKNLTPEKRSSTRRKPPKSNHGGKKRPPTWKQTETFRPLGKALLLFLRRILRSLHAFRLIGNLSLGLETPAQTGQLFGFWHALQNWLPAHRLSLQPEFLRQTAEGWISTEVAFRPVCLFLAGVPFYWSYRKISRSRTSA